MQVPIGLIWMDGRSPLSQARCARLLAFEGLGRDLLDLVRHGDNGGGGEDGVEVVSFPSVLASKGLRQNVWCISGSAKGAVTGGYGT